MGNLVNSAKPYFFRLDIAKEAARYARLTNWLKTRVNDNGKKVPVKWYDQGQVMQVHGLSPFIQGGVGHYSIDEDDELIPSTDVVYRDWQGTPADVTDDGVVYYTLEDQFFCQEGKFKGTFGLRDNKGNVYTSVNIVFEILGDDLRIGSTTKFYSAELDKIINNFKIQTQQVIDDARKQYNDEIRTTRDSLGSLQTQIQTNRDEQAYIANKLNDVNKSYQDANKLIDDKLAQRTDYKNSDIQSMIKSATTGTIVTGYDFDNYKPKTEIGRYTDKYLVDQLTLTDFAGAINWIKSKMISKHEDAVDVNTLFGRDLGITTHICHSQNNTNTPSYYKDKRGTLIVISFDGNAQTQIWFPVGVSGMGYAGENPSMAMRYIERKGEWTPWAILQTEVKHGGQ